MRYLYLLVLYFLVSCANHKKLHKIMDKLPEATAKECAERFPIKETIDTIEVYDTALIKAYEMEFGHLYYMLDSLLGKQISDSTKKEIITIFQDNKVPVVKYKYITKTQEGSAKAQVIRDSCQKMSTLFHKKQDELDKKLDIETQKVKELTDKNGKLSRQRDNLFWLIVLLIISLFRKPLLRIITKTIKPI